MVRNEFTLSASKSIPVKVIVNPEVIESTVVIVPTTVVQEKDIQQKATKRKPFIDYIRDVLDWKVGK